MAPRRTWAGHERAGDGDSEGEGSGDQAHTHEAWGTRHARRKRLVTLGAVREAGSDKEAWDELPARATASLTATGRDEKNARSRTSQVDP